MIIEDEPDAAELFAEMMRLNGFRVIKTYSSTPALCSDYAGKTRSHPSGHYDARNFRP